MTFRAAAAALLLLGCASSSPAGTTPVSKTAAEDPGTLQVTSRVRPTLQGPDAPVDVGAGIQTVRIDRPEGAERWWWWAGRTVGLWRVDSRWVLAADDPVTGQVLYEVALPTWYGPNLPTVRMSDGQLLVYVDQPNPAVGQTSGEFTGEPDLVGDRRRQLDIYVAETGERTWSSGPLPTELADVPDGLGRYGPVTVAGNWAFDVDDGQLLWTGPSVAARLTSGRLTAVGNVAVGPTTHGLPDDADPDLPWVEAVDLTTGERLWVEQIEGRHEQLAVGTWAVLWDNGWVNLVGADGTVVLADHPQVEQGQAVAGRVDHDGRVELLIDTRDDGRLLLTIDVETSEGTLTSADGMWFDRGWQLQTTLVSQVQTTFGFVAPDGTGTSFVATHAYGQRGQTDVWPVDGQVVLVSAGSRVFTLDIATEQVLWDVELGGPTGRFVHVGGGLVVLDDGDGGLVGLVAGW